MKKLGQEAREEFEQLFYELTGIRVSEAEVGEDGWLFIPAEVDILGKDLEKRERIFELTENQWRKRFVNDIYLGWWMKPPD